MQSDQGFARMSMCAKSRNARRSGNSRFPLYAAETLLGWSVISWVKISKGSDMVALGIWREVYDEQNNHVGFQFMPGRQSEQEKLSMQSSTGLVAKDIVLNAGRAFKGGKSRTSGLTENQRINRTHGKTGKLLPPEDAVELVEAKVRIYPELKDGKQDILRVWPKK
jgi:hypothetical protein